MKIIFFGKGKRGLVCLEKLLSEGENVLLIVNQKNDSFAPSFEKIALQSKIESYCPENPNTPSALSKLGSFDADIFVLAGYGLILEKKCLSLPKMHCINLHGGKLPEFRGSSPMNWALLKGEKEIGISIIEVEAGIDTGDIHAESFQRIDCDTPIGALHQWANEQFPELLNDVLKKIKAGTLASKKQDHSKSSYYPRRFPEDGFILWDQINCIDAHNKIRALTDPYPCAFSYLGERKIKFLSSKIPDSPFYGEAGRIYKMSNDSFLIGTRDKAIWITKALFTDDESSAYTQLNVYDRLSTIHQFAELHLNKNENR